jgi:hypothetical protein
VSPDPFEGILSVPLTRHRYLYALGNPVNHLDPGGEFTGSLTEFMTTLSIGAILLRVAIVGGISAILGDYPDAYGIGLWCAAKWGSWVLNFGGVGGVETKFKPRQKTGGDLSGFLLGEAVSERHENEDFFHPDWGGYTAWYWGEMTESPAEKFFALGLSGQAGIYAALEWPLGAERPIGLVTGIAKPGAEFIGFVGSRSFSVQFTPELEMSEGAMLSAVSASESLLSSFTFTIAAVGIGWGAVAATLINTGATGTWVHLTYGKEGARP